MRTARNRSQSFRPVAAGRAAFGALLLLSAAVLLAGCGDTSQPKSEPLIVQTAPPAKQEFRWSNGKSPKSFDPALAAAAPETDIVRALFEGLTDIESRTLKEVPAVAEKWTVSDNYKTWTFYLRDDAKWSNGKPVTADDFVRSWTRLAKMGSKVPHRSLLYNIEGLRELGISPPAPSSDSPDLLSGSVPTTPGPFPVLTPEAKPTATPATAVNTTQPPASTKANANTAAPTVPAVEVLSGVTAESEQVLKVRLISPDRDFAKLVASPMFRPTYDGIEDIPDGAPRSDIVTNGPFKLSGVGPEGVALERSDQYWDRQAVKLDRVLFVPKDGAEKALESYRNGELDAVTNAEFAPLALKLLSPYDDFRQTTHSALNYYEFNTKKAPFSDPRVRRALAMSVERDVLTEGELEGSTRPALTFLPFGRPSPVKLSEDRDLARELLEEAGFPDGLNFPVIRLVVNRNDLQQRIAKVVARMWKQNLNLDTEIVVVDTAGIDAARAAGDFDLIRRGAVFPSNDETMSLRSIFATADEFAAPAGEAPGAAPRPDAEKLESRSELRSGTSGVEMPVGAADEVKVLNEQQAITDLKAIPLYFPTSYSLVKPYVSGFDINSLDAPSLKDVSIDNSWQPK